MTATTSITTPTSLLSKTALLKIVRQTSHLLDENKATNICSYDVSATVYYTNYILICCGSSSTHRKALAEKVRRLYKKQKLQPYKEQSMKIGNLSKGQNLPENGWIILDYGDIVVHVISSSLKEYYALDALYGKTNSLHKLHKQNDPSKKKVK